MPMSLLTGVSAAYHSDGSRYYRASVTFNGKHISLGGYPTQEEGHQAYLEASSLLHGLPQTTDAFASCTALSFSKFITLLNYRNNGVYIKTPIYLFPSYFLYYLEPDLALKFDKDDLFFYSTHTIQQKGGYLFVCHYGSQYGILSRYGIRNYAVEGRDYVFMNGDNHDYRYQNIKVLNHFMGVCSESKAGRTIYTATIHINGNYMIGRYETEEDAAIAYNKAADILTKKGCKKQFIKNYISSLTADEYHKKYEEIPISDKLYTVINLSSPT